MLLRLNNITKEFLKELKERIERKGGPTCIRVVGTGKKWPEVEGKKYFGYFSDSGTEP